jgi:hypothetical protein
MISIQFSGLTCDGLIHDTATRLLRINADFKITIGGRVWFSEPDFPVVELAVAAQKWLLRGGDFEFETMEAAEAPFLWVRGTADGCELGAVWQAFVVDAPLPCDSLQAEFARFVTAVDQRVRDELNIDIPELRPLSRA